MTKKDVYLRKCKLCKNKFHHNAVIEHPFEKEGWLGTPEICPSCYDKVYSEKGYDIHITDGGDRLYIDKNDDGNIAYIKNCIFNLGLRLDSKNPDKLDKENETLFFSVYDLLLNEAEGAYGETMRKLGKMKKNLSDIRHLVVGNGKRDERAVVGSNFRDKNDFPEVYFVKTIKNSSDNGTIQFMLRINYVYFKGVDEKKLKWYQK